MSPPHLTVLDHLGHRIIPITGERFTFGRSPRSDLRLEDSDIAFEHAVIVRQGTEYLLKDLGSGYPTLVNGESVQERFLEDRDRLQIGRAELLFWYGERPPAKWLELPQPGAVEAEACLQRALKRVGSGPLLDEVVNAFVDAAVDFARAERGFIALGSDLRDPDVTRGRSRAHESVPPDQFPTPLIIASRVPVEGITLGADVTAAPRPLERFFKTLFTRQRPANKTPPVDRSVKTPTSIAVAVQLPPTTPTAEAEPMQSVLYVEGVEPSHWSLTSGLEVLAQEAAVLIRDLQAAAKVRHALLPPGVRQGTHFTAAAASLPCRVIGGDFFEYVDLASGEFGFLVCDVAGKGAPAALLSAVLQGIFSTVSQHSDGPAYTVSRMNHALLKRPIDSRFATVLYGVLSSDGRLTHCNGGHNAPFLFTQNSARRLETGGPVIGLFEKVGYYDETTRLEPGDLYVAFSDGVTEATNEAGEEFGDARLLALLSTARHQSPPQILEVLFSSVREFCSGSPQADDVTALVVRFEG